MCAYFFLHTKNVSSYLTDHEAPDNRKFHRSHMNSESWACSVFLVTLVASRIWRWLLDFVKICGPLMWATKFTKKKKSCITYIYEKSVPVIGRTYCNNACFNLLADCVWIFDKTAGSWCLSQCPFNKSVRISNSSAILRQRHNYTCSRTRLLLGSDDCIPLLRLLTSWNFSVCLIC